MAISSYASSSSPYFRDQNQENDCLSILLEESLQRDYFQQLEEYLENSNIEEGRCNRELNVDNIKKCLAERPENKRYHRLFLGMSFMSVCPPLPPRELLSRERITWIILSNNELTAIPEQVYEFTSLRTLDVSNNKIREISSKIGSLKELEKLNLEENAVEALPEELYELTHMTSLDVSYNKMTVLSSRIGEFVHLEHLHLLDNPLTEIPVTLWKLKKLVNLEVDQSLKKDSREKIFLQQNLDTQEALKKLDLVADNFEKMLRNESFLGRLEAALEIQ